MARRVRCTWCDKLGQPEEMKRRRDAAGLLHYFHEKTCWKAHVNFMRRKPTKVVRKVER
jgi:hypothetical protein